MSTQVTLLQYGLVWEHILVFTCLVIILERVVCIVQRNNLKPQTESLSVRFEQLNGRRGSRTCDIGKKPNTAHTCVKRDLPNDRVGESVQSKVISYRKKSKTIPDTLLGHIKLHPLILAWMDTVEMQHLRYIKQLQSSHLVFPAAVHTRFQHSIQVACVTTQYLTHLLQTYKEANEQTKQRWILLATLAGFLHDSGHICFSHNADHYMYRKFGTPHHEERGVDLIRWMITKYGLETLGLASMKEVDVVCGMIMGTQVHGEEYPEFLFQIVANKAFEFDTDKVYLRLDRMQIGHGVNMHQLPHIIEHSRIINGVIAFDTKMYNFIWDGVFHLRYLMWRDCYQHRVTRAIDEMVTDIFDALQPAVQFDKIMRMNPGEWRKINDSLLESIPLMNLIGAFEGQPEKEKAYADAEVIWNRIHSRELYKVTDLRGLTAQEPIVKCEYCNTHVSMMKEDGNTPDGEHVFRTATLGICGPDRNPMNDIWFFHASEPDVVFHQSARDDGVMLPVRNKERWRYIVCRNPINARASHGGEEEDGRDAKSYVDSLLD